MSNISDFFPSGKPTRITPYASGAGTHTFLAATTWFRYLIVGGAGGGQGGGGNVTPAYGGPGGGAGATANGSLFVVGGTSMAYAVGAGGAGTVGVTGVDRGANATAGSFSRLGECLQPR